MRHLFKALRYCRVSAIKLPSVLYRVDAHRCYAITNNIEATTDNGEKQLATATTIDSVLVTAASLDSLTATQVSIAFQSLDRLAYDHLSTFPWAMYDNRTMLCIQSFLSQDAKEFFRPVIKCPQFEVLRNEAGTFSSTFSNLELTNVTLSLIRLHVEPIDETFVKLVQECQSRCESFDLETLSAYAEVGNYMKRSGFHISSKIARILQERWETLEITPQNFGNVSWLLFCVGYFMSKDTLWYFQAKLRSTICQLRDDLDPKNILEVMEPVTRFSSRTRSDLVGSCLEIIDEHLDELTAWQLHRCILFCRELEHPLVPVLSKKVCDRGFKFLNGNGLRAADVVHLLSVFDICNYPKHSRSTLEKLLEVYVEDFDVILLKNASLSRIVFQGGSGRLSEQFCQCVRHKLHSVGESISCLLAIVHCLAKMSNRPPSVDGVMSEFLFHLVINSQVGLQPSHVAAIGRYLVQCWSKQDERAASVYTDKLLSSLPCLSIMDMINLALGFSAPTFRCSRLYTDYVLSRLTREILQRRDEITSLAILNLIVSTILLKISPALRGGLTQDVIELYDEHTRVDVRQSNVKTTLSILTKLRICIPDVLERLVDSFARKKTSSTVADVSQVLFALAKLNYRPASLHVLRDLAVDVATVENNKDDVLDVLRIAASLASLGIFTKKLIRIVFSLRFLEMFEDALPLENSVSGFRTRKYYERLLMEVNRAVVLQCPHLYVPWFCEAYAENSSNLDSAVVTKWKNIIYDGLIKASGGSEFVKMGPLTASYGITYDYEIALDGNGKPIPYDSIGHNRSRVAVLLSAPGSYSMNNRISSTSLENKVTQLEILGFRVVQIPYFDLDSMQLSDLESRKQYFKEKVLCTEVKRRD